MARLEGGIGAPSAKKAAVELLSIRICPSPCLRYAQLPRMPTHSLSTGGALIFSMPSSPLTTSATRSQENQ